uniref:DUF6265 family protein n=1 Tax=Gelidibacter sp. TaxID=2018083 RepID=UPI00404B905A
MNFKIVLVLIYFSFEGIAQDKMEQLDFLVGTWKMEGKPTYEHWTKEANVLVGESFKVEDDIKYVSETLRIEEVDKAIVYTAAVVNQNDGKGIAFTLNPEVTDALSFENTAHDFPKKIRYIKLTDTEVFVEVLGDNGQGFSFKMLRQ